jgi:SAP domain
MLSRTLRHSRSAPSLRALSPGPGQGQIAHIHSNPSATAAVKSAKPPVGSPLAKGWREKTVVELKAELKRRGLPTTGRKEEVLILLSLF